MIAWNEYWQGGQYYEHDAGRAVKAIVDVAWYDEYSGKWTTRSQLVRWYLAFDGTVQSETGSGC